LHCKTITFNAENCNSNFKIISEATTASIVTKNILPLVSYLSAGVPGVIERLSLLVHVL